MKKKKKKGMFFFCMVVLVLTLACSNGGSTSGGGTTSTSGGNGGGGNGGGGGDINPATAVSGTWQGTPHPTYGVTSTEVLHLQTTSTPGQIAGYVTLYDTKGDVSVLIFSGSISGSAINLAFGCCSCPNMTISGTVSGNTITATESYPGGCSEKAWSDQVTFTKQ